MKKGALMTRPTLMLLALALLMPVSAQAALITPKGAQTLKDMILKTLYAQKQAYEQAGGNLGIEGEIGIEEADGYYAVTLPRIIVTDAAGNRGEIGLIAINAVPEDLPGNWKMSVALPTPLMYYDAAGKPATRIDIGTQRMAGVWNEKLGQFTKLDAAFDNLKIANYAFQSITTLKSFSIISNLQESGENTWSGDVYGLAKNISTKLLTDQSESKIGEAKFTMGVTHLSPFLAAPPAAGGTIKNPLSDVIGVAASGFKIQSDLRNIALVIPRPGGAPVNATWDTFSMGVDVSGLRETESSIALKTSWKNLGLDDPDIKNLAPRDLNVDLAMNKIPLDRLAAFIKTQKQSTGQMAGIQAMLMLPQIFSQAGTSLKINDSFARNDLYDSLIKGDIRASDTSVTGATGQVRAEIGGMDNLIAALKTQKDSASEAKKAELDRIIQQMTLVSALGAQGKSADGKPVRTYDFVMAEDGKMTLNGTDISTLMAPVRKN